MRWRRWIGRVALWAWLAAAGGCGDRPPPLTPAAEQSDRPPPRPDGDAGLHPGEKLAAAVQVRGLPAGQVVTVVGEPCRVRARRTIPVRTVGRSTGLASAFRDVWVDVTSLIDAETGRPLQTRTHKKWRKPLLIEVEVDEQQFWWRRRRRGKQARTGERDLPGPTHDVQSVLALLRNWRPAVRPEAQVHVLVDRRLWRVELMYRGGELLDAAGEQRPAVRIDGVAQRLKSSLEPSRAKPAAFSVWIADDPNRAPLRFIIDTKYGEVQADLAQYERQASARSALGAAPTAQGQLEACPNVVDLRAIVEAEARTSRHDRPRQPAPPAITRPSR